MISSTCPTCNTRGRWGENDISIQQFKAPTTISIYCGMCLQKDRSTPTTVHVHNYVTTAVNADFAGWGLASRGPCHRVCATVARFETHTKENFCSHTQKDAISIKLVVYRPDCCYSVRWPCVGACTCIGH